MCLSKEETLGKTFNLVVNNAKVKYTTFEAVLFILVVVFPSAERRRRSRRIAGVNFPRCARAFHVLNKFCAHLSPTTNQHEEEKSQISLPGSSTCSIEPTTDQSKNIVQWKNSV